MNEPDDTEQHGSIVTLVFCIFVIGFIAIAFVGMGG